MPVTYAVRLSVLPFRNAGAEPKQDAIQIIMMMDYNEGLIIIIIRK